MTQDLTKITTPWGLLSQEDPETAKALEECGGPWQMWHGRNIWLDCFDKPSLANAVYRKKPEPREYVAWMVLNADGSVFGTFFLEDIAKSWVAEDRSLIKLTGVRHE